MRRTCFSILLAGLGLAAALSSAAQTTAQTAEQTPAPEKTRAEPLVQEIHLQDKSVAINEVRVGGQTQSIEVKPSNEKLRPYQVQPEKADAGISDKSSAKGMTNRSWKLFNF
jgi:hypothetical protein